MTVPGNVSAKKLAGDYLADLTQVALRYLPKGDRMKFVGRTKALIERRCGPLTDAEPDQVAALLAELGTPRELVMKERERLDQAWARRRSAARGTGASPAAPWEQRPITSRFRPATGERVRPPRVGRLLRGRRGQQDQPGAPGPAGDQDTAAAPDAPPAHAPPRWPGSASAAGPAAGPASAAADAGPVEAAAAQAGTADASTADVASVDASTADAGAAEAGPADAGAAEAGTADAGTADAGTADAAADAGTVRAGTADAGTADAGRAEAGTADAGTADARTAGTGEPEASGPLTSGAAAGEWTPPVPAGEWAGSGTGGQDAAGNAPGGEQAAAGLAGTEADVAGQAAPDLAAPDAAEPAPGRPDAAERDPARQDAAQQPPADQDVGQPGADGELVPWLAAIEPTSVVRPPLPPVPARSVAPGPPTIPGLTLADDAGSELVPARGPAGTLVPLTPAGLASMARGHRREALAVILLGVGGLLLPLPCWPLGAAVAGFSRFWEARYRWVSLYGPVLVTLILTVPLAAMAGGHGNVVSIYLHTIWLDARYLVRIGCVLTAVYLTWLVRRGPQERVPPWRR